MPGPPRTQSSSFSLLERRMVTISLVILNFLEIFASHCVIYKVFFKMPFFHDGSSMLYTLEYHFKLIIAHKI
jgi:hypothetical protein